MNTPTRKALDTAPINLKDIVFTFFIGFELFVHETYEKFRSK